MSKRKKFRSPLLFRDAQRRADKWAGTPDAPYLELLPGFAKGLFRARATLLRLSYESG
jgi:hypothetical protein